MQQLRANLANMFTFDMLQQCAVISAKVGVGLLMVIWSILNVAKIFERAVEIDKSLQMNKINLNFYAL